MPELTARTLTDATIWRARADWRLTLRSSFEPREKRMGHSPHRRINLVTSKQPALRPGPRSCRPTAGCTTTTKLFPSPSTRGRYEEKHDHEGSRVTGPLAIYFFSVTSTRKDPSGLIEEAALIYTPPAVR